MTLQILLKRKRHLLVGGALGNFGVEQNSKNVIFLSLYTVDNGWVLAGNSDLIGQLTLVEALGIVVLVNDVTLAVITLVAINEELKSLCCVAEVTLKFHLLAKNNQKISALFLHCYSFSVKFEVFEILQS